MLTLGYQRAKKMYPAGLKAQEIRGWFDQMILEVLKIQRFYEKKCVGFAGCLY